MVIATDGVASIAVFTYQCISVVEEQDEPLFVIGYSINDTLYQQITFNTTSACLNDSVFYQLNIGQCVYMCIFYVSLLLYMLQVFL